MRKFVFCFLLLVPASILAQSSPQNVNEVHVSQPKPGMTAQFEAGRKKHSDFHAAQKDTWAIYVWEVMTGEHAGSFVSVAPDHHWSDFGPREAFNKIDVVDVAKNLDPYTANSFTLYSIFRDDLSRTKPPATPAAMQTLTFFTVIPGHAADFTDAVKKINAAVAKSNITVNPSRWYELANGGDVSSFVLITDRASWANMEPPEKKVADIVKEAYGDTAVLDQLYRSCSRVNNELQVYRPDLSYVPK